MFFRKRVDTLTLNSTIFPDPYDWVTDANKLTIEFYGYQGFVRYSDLHKCVTNADRDIIQKIAAGQDHNPMGANPYLWSSGSVMLHLSPGEELTWSMWSLVPVTIQQFVAANELRETQFKLIWRGIGPVGTGQIVAADGTNSSTTTTSTGLKAFPDPYDEDHGQSLTIEFYGYQGLISPIPMRDCVEAALRDTIEHFDSGIFGAMAADSYSYSADGVNLILRPEDTKLTWRMWAFVPTWILKFVTENEYKGTQFILLWRGLGVVGRGQLVSSSSTGGVPSTPRLDVS